jgi:K+-sensing histidine kinase KdpD
MHLASKVKMLEQMNSIVNHELLTPLKCVVLVAETLEKSLSDRVQIRQARIMIDTTSFILAQVKCFLDRNIIESNSFLPHYEKVTFKQVVYSAVQIMNAQAS